MSPASPYDPTPNDSATSCWRACTRLPSDIVGASGGVALKFVATPPITLNPWATKYSPPSDVFHAARERIVYVASNVRAVAAPPATVVDWAVRLVFITSAIGTRYDSSISR